MAEQNRAKQEKEVYPHNTEEKLCLEAFFCDLLVAGVCTTGEMVESRTLTFDSVYFEKTQFTGGSS